MLVFLHPHVLSRVAGFPVASPCLWGKLENMSYSNVSKQVVMSFCVAGVALCDIPNLFDNVLKMSKLVEVSYEMLVFLHPRVLSRVAGCPVASPCLWGKLENMSYSNVSKQVVMPFCVAGVALCDIPNLFDNVLKMSKLEEVSYEMLVFLHPRVLSRVAGFPVASPCLWGKLQNMSYSNVSKQVVMPFCVAGVALCDIPNLFDNVLKMSKLEEVSYEMLVFLHPRVLSRVAGFPVASPCLWGKLENMSYSNVSKQVVMSFCVAGMALCDIPNLFDNVLKMSKLEEVSYEMLVFLHPRVLSRVAGCPVASPCLCGKLRTSHSTLYTPHSPIYNLDSTLYTLHSTLYTLHFTLLTPHLRLYNPH